MSSGERLRFLADASALLAASLDIDEALRQIARGIVPAFADWCTITVIDDAGVPRRLAGSHADPAREPLMAEYLAKYEPAAHKSDVMLSAFRDGKASVIPRVEPAMLEATAQDADHLRLMQGLGCTASIVMPMIARGAVIGAIAMQMASDARRFDDDLDVQLARELAGRAALAIDNARRFAAERVARERAERAEAATRELLAERQELLREAQAAGRAKDDFLAMLGHELRNPLAPIVTAVELMNRTGGPFEWERAVIARQTKHLTRLVDDLLDVSRIAGGKVALDREPVDLVDVVFAAIEMAAGLFEGKNHRVFVDVGDALVVSADHRRMVQVVVNLLTNAAKYTGGGGEIRVLGERDGETAVLRVRDSGIGIAPEMLPHVFELFAQERQSLDRAMGGLGLGLAIVKSLVEAQGGRVFASSAGIDRGSEFAIRLPLAVAMRPTPPPAVAAPRGEVRAVDLLVVDDNQDAAALLAASLTAIGHRVEVAYDGAAALALCDGFTPTAALLDIGLPIIDGYELAQRLRRRPGFDKVCLIAVTGYGSATDRARALAGGFDHHLVKPVSVAAIQAILDAL